MANRTKAEVLLFSVTLIWGSTFVVTKGALESISPFLYIALRFTLAAIILVAFQPRIVKIDRQTFLKGGFLGLLLLFGLSLQTIGLQYTTASKSAFITGMLVVLTPLCQIAIERRLPKAGNIIGVVLVTIGLYFLTSPDGSEMNIGDWLTLGCALCWALYIVYLDTYGGQYHPAQLTFAQFIVSAVGGALGAMLLEESVFLPSLELYSALVYISVFATVAALFIQTKYQKETTPTRAAVIFSAEPVFAAILAYIVLDEVIGSLGILGGVVIFAGLLVSELSDVLFGSAQGNKKPLD